MVIVVHIHVRMKQEFVTHVLTLQQEHLQKKITVSVSTDIISMVVIHNVQNVQIIMLIVKNVIVMHA